MAKRPEDVIIEELDLVMNDFVDRIFQLSQENLTEPHVKDFKSGKSKNIITTHNGALLGTANVIKELLHKRIVYPAPYAEDIEFGTTTTTAEPSELEEWVRRKVFKNRGTPAQVAKTAANISKSLKKLGISPDPFLGPAVSVARQEFKV